MARSAYLCPVRPAVINVFAGAARLLRRFLLRAFPLVLLFCVASPLLAEAGHSAHEWTSSSQQTASAEADDPAVPHQSTCLECPQHAWDRGREAFAGVVEHRVATGRVVYALADDGSRSSVVGVIIKPPRA